MLAKALVNLLPELSSTEQVATTKLHSLVGEADGEIISQRAFRSPTIQLVVSRSSEVVIDPSLAKLALPI